MKNAPDTFVVYGLTLSMLIKCHMPDKLSEDESEVFGEGWHEAEACS
jgi:hypothetical protein